MTWNVARELSNATRSVGFRGGVAVILLATVAMLCGAQDAAAVDESEKGAAITPPQAADEPAAVATLRVRKVDTDDERDQYRKTQLQLIKSPFVLASALRRPGIANLEALRAEKDQVSWLQARIEAIMGADAEVVQIRMRGADRRESQQIVNAVAQAYLSEVVNKGKADQLARHKVILKKYGEMMAELGALAAEAKLPANGDADVEARRKKIEQLEDVTNKMALSLEALAAELQAPSRVEAIDVASVGDGAVK